jgi:hypothetical protein
MHWLIWSSTIASMLFMNQSCTIMMVVMMYLVCEDYKKGPEEFRERANLYMLVLSGMILATAWLRPATIICSFMLVSWVYIAFRKKSHKIPQFDWFAGHLLSLQALRFYCLAIAVAIVSYVVDTPGWFFLGVSGSTIQHTSLALLSIPGALGLSLIWRKLLLRRTDNRFSRFLKTAWQDQTFYAFVAAHIFVIVSFICTPDGPGEWFINWLVSSARDANLLWIPTLTYSDQNSLQAVMVKSNFDLPFYLKTGMSIASLLILMPRILSSSAFLTSYARRFKLNFNVQAWVEDFLEVLRQPTQKLNMKEAVPWLHHASATFFWLLFCYLILFGMVALTPGPLGEAFVQWLDCSFAETGFVPKALYDYPQLRLFLASIVAMMGLVPLAVMGCAFLPALKSKYISLSADGILLPQGPFIPMGFRPLRAWCDMRSIKIKEKTGETRPDKRTLILSFFSGGSLKLKLHQLSSKDLYDLLSAIDEHADDCFIAPEVLELRRSLSEENGSRALPAEGQLRNLPAENFRSTVFVPYEVGQTIPNTRMRVVRQLSAKQLSAVYLVRREDGRLAIAKQFCFPGGTENGAADTKLALQVERMRKNFHREYELLAGLNNPRIAKVLDVLEHENSNILVLEHASGRDLREIVDKDGLRSEAVVLEIARQLCDVMIYLHQQSPAVLHRDLTPDNLVIDEDRNVRLIDFGAAHQFLEGITGTLIGKQCYVAPEQLRGEPSTRSDIYSFGCTLYFLLTGDDPVALSQCDPGEQSAVSRAFRSLIMQCTSFEESDRPNSFIEISRSIQEIKDGTVKVTEDPGFRIKLPGEEIMVSMPMKTGEGA